MMPSHVIADELGLGDGGVTTAMHQQTTARPSTASPRCGTPPGTSRPDIDLKQFPSSGPYKLDSVTKDGAVVLVANDKWWGAKPVTAKVTVWPRGADIQDRVNQGAYDVVDIAAGSSGTLNLPDDYVRTDAPSAGIEQLIFAPQGPLADAAGAACAGAVHAARRDRPQRRGADRQLAAEPRDRGRIQRGRGRRRGRPVQRRQPGRRPGRDQRTAADRPHRLSEPQRPAGGDRRCDRQGVRAGRHHRAGRRVRRPRAR